MKNLIDDVDPRVIVHCAAKKNVGWCEKNPMMSRSVNVVGTRNICNHSRGRKLIFLSSCYVFSGREGMYKRMQPTNPSTVYGKNKVEAEEIVGRLPDYAILRLGAVYGWGGKKTFINWLLGRLYAKHAAEVYENYYFSPIYVANLCEAVERVIEDDCKGTYHIAGNERISKYDFALKVSDAFKIDRKLVHPVSYTEVITDYSLDTMEEQKLLKTDFGDVDSGLKRMICEEESRLATFE